MKGILKWGGIAFAALILIGVGASLGGTSDKTDGTRSSDESSAAKGTPEAQRGVALVASELASLCVDRLGTSEQGDQASPAITRLVDELVTAYQASTQNAGATHQVQVAYDNMRHGCGADQADKLATVLAGSGQAPTVEAKPEAEHNMDCGYVLGDFGDSGDPSKGYRLVGGGRVTNTGNVGVIGQITITWEMLGQAPVKEQRQVRLAVGKSKRVSVTVPVGQDAIDLHQSADGDCKAKMKLTDTFGKPQE